MVLGEGEGNGTNPDDVVSADSSHPDAVTREVSGTASLLGTGHTMEGRPLGRYVVLEELGRGGMGIMGTPPFMAPEQHTGREQGAAVDQYAFCCRCGPRSRAGCPFEPLRVCGSCSRSSREASKLIHPGRRGQSRRLGRPPRDRLGGTRPMVSAWAAWARCDRGKSCAEITGRAC